LVGDYVKVADEQSVHHGRYGQVLRVTPNGHCRVTFYAAAEVDWSLTVNFRRGSLHVVETSHICDFDEFTELSVAALLLISMSVHARQLLGALNSVIVE